MVMNSGIQTAFQKAYTLADLQVVQLADQRVQQLVVVTVALMDTQKVVPMVLHWEVLLEYRMANMSAVQWGYMWVQHSGSHLAFQLAS